MSGKLVTSIYATAVFIPPISTTGKHGTSFNKATYFTLVNVSANVLKAILPEAQLFRFQRPKNLRDELVKAKLKPAEEVARGMFICGNKKCKICGFVKTGPMFCNSSNGRNFHIHHPFDCNSGRVVYLITCKNCLKQYVGCTITSFRARFNNHKSSLRKFGNGNRGICGEHLYAYFFSEGHHGVNEVQVQVIDVTDVARPTVRESYSIDKRNCLAPLGLE